MNDFTVEIAGAGLFAIICVLAWLWWMFGAIELEDDDELR